MIIEKGEGETWRWWSLMCSQTFLTAWVREDSVAPSRNFPSWGEIWSTFWMPMLERVLVVVVVVVVVVVFAFAFAALISVVVPPKTALQRDDDDAISLRLSLPTAPSFLSKTLHPLSLSVSHHRDKYCSFQFKFKIWAGPAWLRPRPNRTFFRVLLQPHFFFFFLFKNIFLHY